MFDQTIDMNPEGCEFPIESRFYDGSTRSCGRAGHGRHLRLCWQHHEAMWARVFADLYDRPNLEMSSRLASWIQSTKPSQYDDPERAKDRAKCRRVALTAFADVLGSLDGDLPDELRDALAPIVDKLIEERLAAQFGAAS